MAKKTTRKARSASSSIVSSYKNLPWILKLILCIPAIEIVNSVIRLIDGIRKKDFFKTLISILMIVPGAAFMWLVDLVCVILTGNAFWL